MANAIKTELMKATKLTTKVGEKQQVFFKRLQSAADKLKDDVWEGLSEAAQNWQNAATKAVETDKDIAGFDDGDAPAPKKAKDDKPAKSSAPAKSKAKDEDDRPAKKATTTKSAGDGIKVRIKKLLIKKPKLSVDEVVEQLSKDGEKLSRDTCAFVRSEFRQTVRVMQSVNCDVMKIDLG